MWSHEKSTKNWFGRTLIEWSYKKGDENRVAVVGSTVGLRKKMGSYSLEQDMSVGELQRPHHVAVDDF